MTSLAQVLAVIEPHYPAALIGPDDSARLGAVARLLPATLGRSVYFECRLAQRGTDLIVDVDAAGRDVLAGRNPVIALDETIAERGSWPRVRAFMREWSDTQHPMHEAIAGAWIEFDLADDSAVLSPSVFVDFTDSVIRDDTLERRLAAVIDAAGALGVAIDPVTQASVSRCIAALPHTGMLLYTGFMFGRDTAALRLCVMGLTHDDLTAYLHAIGWHGDAARVSELVAFFAGAEGGGQSQPAIVHFDVGREIGSSLGLEYPLARRAQIEGSIAESAFLDALVSRGMLSSTEREGLDSWPGYERRTMPHDLWPSILARRVNHVKVVVGGDGETHAKVYLCAEQVVARAEGIASE